MKRIFNLTAVLLLFVLSAAAVAGPPKSLRKSIGESFSRGGSSLKKGGFSSQQKNFGRSMRLNSISLKSNVVKSTPALHKKID
jgi:hypothetical protein